LGFFLPLIKVCPRKEREICLDLSMSTVPRVAGDFSPTSLAGGGHDQLIRESFLSPISPGFWDGMGSLLNVGSCARLWARKRPNATRVCGAGPGTLTGRPLPFSVPPLPTSPPYYRVIPRPHPPWHAWFTDAPTGNCHILLSLCDCGAAVCTSRLDIWKRLHMIS
jgi:hypothetical protein